MAGTDGNNVARNGTARSPVGHFGRQMRKERLARGWTISDLSKHAEIAAPHLSRIEGGRRPPTARIAGALDAAFGTTWFMDWYLESRTWMPPGFRDWPEIENKAAELMLWTPGVVNGLAQTVGYASELLSIHPGATPDIVAARLANRMERQRRLLRDGGPRIMLLVDMVALYRGVGSAAIMARQCARLAEVASMDAVTLQLVPPVNIPLATASLMLADNASAYTENALEGAVYTTGESVFRVRLLLDTVRAEARPASESLAIIRRAEAQWTP